MTKKGGSTLTFLALLILLISVIVWFSYLEGGKKFAKKEISLKAASAKNIALMIDTIYAYPYDMEIEYDIDLSKFVVEISENSVKIHDSSLVNVDSNKKLVGKDENFAQYGFVPINDDPTFIFDKPKDFIFKKIDGKLTIIEK